MTHPLPTTLQRGCLPWRDRALRLLATCMLAALPVGAWAAGLVDENLVHGLPSGYKIGYQTRQGNMMLTEMVPQGESVQNWTEMLTSQIFLGLKTTTPDDFQANMQTKWADSCKGAEFAAVARGDENGYPFLVWIQRCPLNSTTGKPEHTYFKAIKGNDSFYVVQRAFKYVPSAEQTRQAMQHLREAKVCDSRLPDRACSKLAPAR